MTFVTPRDSNSASSRAVSVSAEQEARGSSPLGRTRFLSSTVVCYPSLEARRILHLRMVFCTYAFRRGGAESHSIRSTSLLEACAAVLPVTRPCSGCRLPPVVGLRSNRRPRRSSGRPGGLRVVFRRDSKVDAFQRQISALRHQLGGENEDAAMPDHDLPRSIGREGSYLSEYPEFTSIGSDHVSAARGLVDTMDLRLPDSVPPPIPAI